MLKNGNPKAPPVYRPSVSAGIAPPVFRPSQISVQAKPANPFCVESRPGPPVYRPVSSSGVFQRKPVNRLPLVSAPPRLMTNVLQRMEQPPEEEKPKSSAEVAEDNYTVLKNYRTGFLNEIETAFLHAGYNITNIRGAILQGLRAWGKLIPGHSSKVGGSDYGEQGQLDTLCNEAKAFLIQWAGEHPAGTKVKQSGLKHSEEKQKEVAAAKQTSKQEKKVDKHRQWHSLHPHERCSQCGRTGPI